MKKLLTIFILILFSSPSFAGDCTTTAKKGLEVYQEGNYEQAIDLWKDCLDQGVHHPDLLYNLGNAYFRQGQIGFSIFYYESALRLSPNNKDILHNLKYAQSLTKDKVKETDEEENPILTGIYSVHHIIPLKSQLYLILVLAWLMAGIGLFKVLSKSPRAKNACLGIIFGLSLLLGTLALSAGYKIFIFETETKGVVTASTADVTSAPHDRSQTLNILSEGTVFNVLSVEHGWVEIQLGDKIKGFVKTTEVGVIDGL